MKAKCLSKFNLGKKEAGKKRYKRMRKKMLNIILINSVNKLIFYKCEKYKYK